MWEPKYFLQTLCFLATGDWRGLLKIKREGERWGKGKIRQNQGKHCPLWQPIHHGPLFGILLNRPEHKVFVCIDIFFLSDKQFPCELWSLPTWFFHKLVVFSHRAMASGGLFFSFKHILQGKGNNAFSRPF